MIAVLVADDQELVREGLRMMVEAEPDMRVVAEADNGAAAVAAVRQHDPDVVLMDVRMPQVDGIEATARLVAAGSRARIVILTTFDLDEYVYRAMTAGASGFLLKDARREQLVTAIRTVVQGDQLLAPSITRRLVEDFCSRADPREVSPRVARLTEREIEVVQRMARGLSNAEIATELYLGETTVKSHVGRVLDKLGLRDRVQVVVFAYETGLVRPGDAGRRA